MAGAKPIEIDQPQDWIDEQNRKFAAAGNEKRYVRKGGAAPSPAPTASPSPVASSAGEQKTALKDSLGGVTFKPSNLGAPQLSEREKESGGNIPGISKAASNPLALSLSDPENYAKSMGLAGRRYLDVLNKLTDQQRQTFREKFGMAPGAKAKDEMLEDLLKGKY